MATHDLGRRAQILKMREEIKKQTIRKRRLRHHSTGQVAAQFVRRLVGIGQLGVRAPAERLLDPGYGVGRGAQPGQLGFDIVLPETFRFESGQDLGNTGHIAQHAS